MIWQHPWALLGMLALAVPLVIHLLGRRNARITKFPTLRFVGTSRLMATRWTRLSDIGLLLVRMGVIAAAVVALAAPLLLTADREMNRNRAIARAIIVDSSASMMRVVDPSAGAATGETGRDVALREAGRIAGDAATSIIVQTAAPSRALDGAVAWLGTRQGRREVVIISDFQIAALDSADVAGIPADIGVGLVRVAVVPTDGPIEVASRHGSTEIVARVSRDSNTTDIEWNVRAAATAEAGDGITVLAGASERTRADAAREAAMSMGTAAPASDRPIAIVHPGHEGRPALIRDADPLSEPWMGDVVAALRQDAILASVALDAEVGGVGAESSFVAVARTAAGAPLAVAARGTVDGVERLLLFSQADAGSLASAALIAAAVRASSRLVPASELEPATLPEQMVAGWRREAATGPEAASADDGTSDARWLWMLALVLLGVETWMRRAPREQRAPEVARERAA